MRYVAFALLLVLVVGCSDALVNSGGEAGQDSPVFKQVKVSFYMNALVLEKPASEYKEGEDRVYYQYVDLPKVPYAKAPDYRLVVDADTFKVAPGDAVALMDTIRAVFVGVEGVPQAINPENPPTPQLVMKYTFDHTLSADEFERLSAIRLQFIYNAHSVLY